MGLLRYGILRQRSQSRFAQAVDHMLDVLGIAALLEILAHGGGELRPQLEQILQGVTGQIQFRSCPQTAAVPLWVRPRLPACG
jgi:hypothetical protein